MIMDKQCKEYTKFKYCKVHFNEYKIMHAAYHYIDNSNKFEDVELSTLAEVELNMRQLFAMKFNLREDYGHQKWSRYLERLKSSPPVTVISNRSDDLDDLKYKLIHESVSYDDYVKNVIDSYDLAIRNINKNDLDSCEEEDEFCKIQTSRYAINLEYFLTRITYQHHHAKINSIYL